jgi:tetratricopeptide (TPR) repeat protein
MEFLNNWLVTRGERVLPGGRPGKINVGKNQEERAEMGYMKLGKLVVDNRGLSDYHSRVTRSSSSAKHMKRPTFILGLVISLALLAPMVFCPEASAYRDGEFPGVGSRSDWQRANHIYNLAIDQQDAHNYTEEALKLKEAIDIYPFDAEYWNHLGACLMHQNKDREAEPTLRKAISLNPDDWIPLGNLGLLLYNQDRYNESKAAFTQALNLNPPDNQVSEIKATITIIDNLLKSKTTSKR